MYSENVALNAICPYFTMFPLDFPLGVLEPRSKRSDRVIDPFCGRGTTAFAARLLGLRSVGIDSNPVAAAIATAKLVDVKPGEVVQEALRALEGPRMANGKPRGEFWRWAYHTKVLDDLVQLREVLNRRHLSDEQVALRAVVLGALHGPLSVQRPSYFSNQCPRTYAPKPRYALKFWKERSLRPPKVDVLDVIKVRAERYFTRYPKPKGKAIVGDSRVAKTIKAASEDGPFDWVITSPPYYGMRTYVPDQWLRNWFVGGPSQVDYSAKSQLVHSSPTDFADDLRSVWKNMHSLTRKDARMVIRFGGIPDRDVPPLGIIKSSLADSGWLISTVRNAGTASAGKRQADSFLRKNSTALVEYDVWATRA